VSQVQRPDKYSKPLTKWWNKFERQILSPRSRKIKVDYEPVTYTTKFVTLNKVTRIHPKIYGWQKVEE